MTCCGFAASTASATTSAPADRHKHRASCHRGRPRPRRRSWARRRRSCSGQRPGSRCGTGPRWRDRRQEHRCGWGRSASRRPPGLQARSPCECGFTASIALGSPARARPSVRLWRLRAHRRAPGEHHTRALCCVEAKLSHARSRFLLHVPRLPRTELAPLPLRTDCSRMAARPAMNTAFRGVASGGQRRLLPAGLSSNLARGPISARRRMTAIRPG